MIGILEATPFIWQGIATSTAGEIFSATAMDPDPQMIAVGMKKLRTALLIQIVAFGIMLLLGVASAILWIVGALAFSM